LKGKPKKIMNERLLPVRCWSCNSPLQQSWDAFRARSLQGRRSLEAILDELQVRRYCCRRMLLTQPLPIPRPAPAAAPAARPPSEEA